MTKMNVVEVGRYGNPEAVGFTGWVSTRDWIVFEDRKGSLYVYNGRDENGGVKHNGVVVDPR